MPENTAGNFFQKQDAVVTLVWTWWSNWK